MSNIFKALLLHRLDGQPGERLAVETLAQQVGAPDADVRRWLAQLAMAGMVQAQLASGTGEIVSACSQVPAGLQVVLPCA